MYKLIFATLGGPGKIETQAISLTRSIRQNAGYLSQYPIWIIRPDCSEKLSEDGQARLKELDATLFSIHMDESYCDFPFATKVFASAWAEAHAEGQGEILIWMDTDSIVIQEPSELIINPEVKLAYRPVDHTLIGSTFSEPISPFWESIYSDCEVNESKIFPMTTSVDENVIRPYFNAGMLDLHPEIGLLRSWRRNFQRLYKEPQYEEFFKVKALYKIFFHQAVLAGTVLSSIDHAELQELPYLINYPLHMHRDYPKDKKPECLNDLITCRYDIFFDDPEWRSTISIHEPIKTWFEEMDSSLNNTCKD
jgi:hypothetical protein